MSLEKLGRYEILDKIGEGAMGLVYRARDPLLERSVAIKTIKVDLSSDEMKEFERRFAREAKSVARLNHPGIVTIYDAGKAEDIAYIAMEFLQGMSLRELVVKEKSLALPRIVNLVAQVADALDFAHREGIVHRDVKPANIMVLAGDQIKVMDFGIASMQDSGMTMTHTVLGTPKYMSPEQIMGLPITSRADIFSLGVVLYELLSGVAPFNGETISAVMYSVINNPAVFPPAVLAKLPPAFQHILDKSLAKKVEDRYQSAAQMASDLRHYKELDDATILYKVPDSPTILPQVASTTMATDTVGTVARTSAALAPPEVGVQTGAATQPNLSTATNAFTVDVPVQAGKKRSGTWLMIVSVAAILGAVGFGARFWMTSEESKEALALATQKQTDAQAASQREAALQAKIDAEAKTEAQAQRDAQQAKEDTQAKADAQEKIDAQVAQDAQTAKAVAAQKLSVERSSKLDAGRPAATHVANADTSLSQNRSFINSMLADGETALSEKRFREAMTQAKNVLKLEPDNHAAHQLLDHAKSAELEALRNEMKIQ